MKGWDGCIHTAPYKIDNQQAATAEHGASLVAQMVKNPPANVGDVGLMAGSGRSPGEGNGNSLQHSCLGNPMDRGAWRVTVPGVTESDTKLSD